MHKKHTNKPKVVSITSEIDVPSLFEHGMLTVNDAAAFLKVSRSFVYALMKSGKLGFQILGTRRRRIPKTELINYLKMNTIIAPPAG